jgi:hypothetical protein
VTVFCIILSHELSKLGSNGASCLGGLGFDLRPRYGQDFRIFFVYLKKIHIKHRTLPPVIPVLFFTYVVQFVFV